MNNADVIIIGSGPAGYSAAIYTSRAQLATLVLTGSQPGGQLTTTTDVENYAGSQMPITGPELVSKIKAQAERFGTIVKDDKILNINPPYAKASEGKYQKGEDKQTFILQGEGGEYEAQSVIIATGASSKKLGISTEDTFAGRGVSYCATCDGFFFRGKNVVVVGGGDTAMEEALFLTKFAKTVTIIHRRGEFRASKIMLERAQKHPSVRFMTNRTVEEIYGDTVVRGVKVHDMSHGSNTTHMLEDIKTDGVFVAIGHTPSTEFLKGIVELDEKGYIKISSQYTVHSKQNTTKKLNPALLPQTATSVPGIFAAGDCVDPRYRQAIVAAGMGAMAAIDVEHYLAENT